MSIGIYDADVIKYKIVPFNLTAMKLSAYYKKSREIVVFPLDFTPERNRQFFYLKDWDDGDYPNLNINNVSYMGHAFSGTQYKALEEDIELMHPDTSIYSRLEHYIVNDNSRFKQTVFKQQMEAEHCRISLDGINLWNQYMKPFNNLAKTKHIIFHDYNLALVKDSFLAIQDLLKYTRHDGCAPRLGMKFPIVVNNEKDLLQWSALKPNQIFYSLRYEGIMTTSQFYSWCAKGYEKVIYSDLDYYVTLPSCDQNDFIVTCLPELFKQVIISRSYRHKITLNYSDDFFIDKRWEKVLDLINFYQHSMTDSVHADAYIKEVQNDTLFDFAKKSLTTYGKYPKMFTKNEMRELFHFVGEYQPTLFQFFYELNYNTLKEQL